MYYQLSRLGLLEIKQKGYSSQFSGSSSLKCYNNHIFKKEKKSEIIESSPEDSPLGKLENDEKIKASYGLKKNKIRNKILNFFSLNASKKFCAFYTVTFPLGIDDDLAYQLLNTWLTRCRRDAGLKSYLWVAERQKNNTLHFHLITNNYMQIGKVNDFMKASLQHAHGKGKLNCRQNIINKYNGIDVDNIHYPKKRKGKPEKLNRNQAQRKLSMYLTKYISKNDMI